MCVSAISIYHAHSSRVTGILYTDLVTLYGIARAGFVPQVFSLRMSVQGKPIIVDLLAATSGKALIFDPSLAEHITTVPLPTFPIPAPSTITGMADAFRNANGTLTLPPLPEVLPTDIAVIFHTSGTTSGKPKPIPETHRWIKSQGQQQWPNVWSAEFHTPAVVNNLGSFANLGSAISKSPSSILPSDN